ncbi:ATP-binding protein [bacterium]|jgi:tRNA uridine 5-carbamoylmethylation protein Kti12|nr:ATP-binding protein [bacterium]MBT4649292.1 ATP-binding protein [bacterium]
MSYLIIIRGPLGVGKTTIAKKLAVKLKGEYFSVDKILGKYKLGYDAEGGNISQKSFLKTNKILAPEARKFLDKNIPVIFDGNFYWQSHINDLVNKLGVKHYIFTLHASLETCIKRDEDRDKTYGVDAAKAVYKRSVELDRGTVINTMSSEESVLKEIISFL